ncbi:response regulator [bacterium]|nr:response regulator [bacterium]
MNKMDQQNATVENREIPSSTVLIVEDDKGLLRLIQNMLNREGHTTQGVTLGQDAIKIIDQDQPSLMLLDFRLPDMTGMKVIDTLITQKNCVPFIVMTGQSDNNQVVSMMKLGARDYLLKEGDYLELLPQVVNQVILQLDAEKKLKEAENQLIISEKRYRLLFERNVVGNYQTTLDGRILDCNEAFAHIFGYKSSKEIMKQSTNELYLDSDDRGQFLKQLRKKGVIRNHEMCLKKKDNNPVWILESVIMISDDEEPEPTIQGSMIDITTRKQAEEALCASEELNRGIINTAPIGIIYLDMNGTIIYENPVMANLMGDPEDTSSNIIGQKIQEIPSMVEFGGDKIVNRLLKGEVLEGEQLNYLTPQGETRILQIHAAPRRGSNSEIIGAVYMSADITEYRTLEEQYLQSQKMEAIGQLAGGIAHDFNNLLMGITGHSELALLKLDPDDPSVNSFEEIKKSADRAASLTRQLLAFSRKQILEPKIVDCKEIIINMEKMLKRIIGENIELVTVTTPELWSVKVDPGQMEQVIMNLVVNARDAMPEGGKLTIETANTEIDKKHSRKYPELKPGLYIKLSVVDNGCGMTEEVKSKIFEPFFTTKEPGKGTGLGLATVYGIIEQSDGHISVSSKIGKGTSFIIHLPMVGDQAQSTSSKVDADKLPRGSETILVVEDEDIVRDLACNILKKQGYKVLEASSGSEAFQMYQNHKTPIDLVITDVVMPNMGGPEFYAKLREISTDVKVLFMTGYTDDTIIKNKTLNSGTPILQKPFKLATLAIKVRDVLDKKLSIYTDREK